jgi:DegV family protein with EDD domain
MPDICILTDSTAQFTRPNFPGHELVYVIPFHLQSEPRPGGKNASRQVSAAHLVPPTPQEFLAYFAQLGRQHATVLVITLSSSLSEATHNAQEAAIQYNNLSAVQIFDSQTTAIGLGLLVQAAAEAAARGASFQEIEHWLRAAIPRIYMLFCIPELTYLAAAGYLAYPQAMVGEMMGLLPIFTLEDGRLTPMEKVRTQRHLFESFQEFMEEFENPSHIALMYGASHLTLRTRPLRIYVQENFPRTPFSEHPISPHVGALFGPQSIGLVIMESV